MSKITKALLYGGLDKKTYYSIKPSIYKDNYKTVNAFSMIAFFTFIVAAILAVFAKKALSMPLYFGSAAAFLMIFLVNILLSHKKPYISNVLSIIYSFLILFAGVFIAYSQKEERTTMLLPLFSLVSLVFCFQPIFVICIISFIEIFYLVLFGIVQSADLFFVNAVNTLIFSIIGIVGGAFTNIVKFKKYEAEYENKTLLERDILTGLFNRYSFNEELNHIVENKEPTSILSFDINGLKTTNDSKGHVAGDELIVGAATCINEVFENIGKSYRVGGDEFFVLIKGKIDEKVIRKQFKEKTDSWKGKLVDSLDIALGISYLDDDYENNLQKALHIADSKMYEEKKIYHLNND